MHKAAVVVLAMAALAPLGLIASPAGAAAGTSCRTTTGAAKFSPALPKLGNKKLVLATITVQGARIGGCVGGGVTGGTISLNSKFSKPGNCSTIAVVGSLTATKGKEIVTWNSGKSSTIALTLTGGVNGDPKAARIAGTVTAGLFKGLHETGTVVYAIPSGGCTKTALSKVMFTQVTSTLFR